MEFIEDDSTFDDYQMHILTEMVKSIKFDLEEAGITGDALIDLTGKLAFNAAAIIDASAVMDFEGQPVLPYLCFAKDESYEEVIATEGGSWMHEYVFGVIDDVFEI